MGYVGIIEAQVTLEQLAAFLHLHVKLGGLGMAPAGYGFHLHQAPPSSDELAAAWRPAISICLDLFGAGRCMFESNFPVDKAACSYGVWWNAFKKIAAAYAAADQDALFHGTAARFYRL
jgi:predicted TIM-barrel fold metal-dependent hydrolase